MSLELHISGTLKKMKGPGSRAINKMLEEKVVPVIMEQITNDVHTKAVEYASGISTPEQKVPQQATHAIGQSDSWYNSTGKLADSIKISYQSTTTRGKHRSIISTDLEYAPWVEFGTGIFGRRGGPIVPKGKLLVFPFQGKTIAASFVLGQPPNPFMRSAKWFLMDNFQSTKEKIEGKFRSMK